MKNAWITTRKKMTKEKAWGRNWKHSQLDSVWHKILAVLGPSNQNSSKKGQIVLFSLNHQFTRISPDCLPSIGKWQGKPKRFLPRMNCKLQCHLNTPPPSHGASSPSASGSTTGKLSGLLLYLATVKWYSWKPCSVYFMIWLTQLTIALISIQTFKKSEEMHLKKQILTQLYSDIEQYIDIELLGFRSNIF